MGKKMDAQKKKMECSSLMRKRERDVDVKKIKKREGECTWIIVKRKKDVLIL